VCWLGEHGDIDGAAADQPGAHAGEAARDLPMADRLGMLLHDVTSLAPAIDPDDVDDEDWVEDYLRTAGPSLHGPATSARGCRLRDRRIVRVDHARQPQLGGLSTRLVEPGKGGVAVLYAVPVRPVGILHPVAVPLEQVAQATAGAVAGERVGHVRVGGRIGMGEWGERNSGGDGDE
jgi:hypothetical protein